MKFKLSLHDIKKQKFCMAQNILNVIPEDPEVEHIAQEMKPASVHMESTGDRC